MRRLFLAAAVAGYLLVSASFPALANNDPRSPGDDCSGNPRAIGQPKFSASHPVFASFPTSGAGSNATNIAEFLGHDNPVDGAASSSNPGDSTGARGQAHFNGGNGCS